jgi:hypothetical protein
VFRRGEKSGSCSRTNAHLSDDKTVAKMGHPELSFVQADLPLVDGFALRGDGGLSGAGGGFADGGDAY